LRGVIALGLKEKLGEATIFDNINIFGLREKN
jgi:hypothetical protein